MYRRRILAAALCAPLLASAFLAAALTGAASALPATFASLDKSRLANPMIVLDRQAFDPRLLANPVIVMDRQ